jgi:hypothetical protein
VFLALGIQHAMRVRHIVTCGLLRLSVFFSLYLTKKAQFSKEKNRIVNKICVLIFSTTFVPNISRSKKK